ncbi:YsnF/AvaK domain-containing protein [Deinococcus sp. HMF7604]|uniref:DUF2382 domain-containing protein n=1 Tax=Deinococcus betulae TaxID=2873312 RepID=UPI001CCDC56B|nr:DUF2382 domain-containing protein [Deinococcus betulae]MBZ9750663.1 YsnF/AvaK domain-containing protein [Deinococcus betulae]
MDNEPLLTRVPVGTLELREERALITTQRVQAGRVEVRRERRTRTETVEVELTEEVLVIETTAGGPQVQVNGLLLDPGTVQEVLLYQERAEVVKQVYAVQNVQVSKLTRTVPFTAQVDLAYEELVVDQQNGVEELVITEGPLHPIGGSS